MKKVLFLCGLISVLGLASCSNNPEKNNENPEIAKVNNDTAYVDLEWDSFFASCLEDENLVYQVASVSQSYTFNVELPGCIQANNGIISVTQDGIYISTRNFGDEDRDFPDVFIAHNFDSYEISGEGYNEFIDFYNDGQLREYKFMAKPDQDYEVMTYVELNKQKLCPEFYTEIDGDGEWKEFTSVENLCRPFTYGDITLFNDQPCRIKLHYGKHTVNINVAFVEF